MARQLKEGITWFPVQTDIFDDRTVGAFITKCGCNAFALMLFLRAEACRYSYYVKADEILLLKALRVFPTLLEDEYATMLEQIVAWGFFDKTLYEMHGVLTSEQIQFDYFHVAMRRLSTDKEYDFLLVDIPERKGGENKSASTKTRKTAYKTVKKDAEKDALENARKTAKKEKNNCLQNVETEDVAKNEIIFPVYSTEHYSTEHNSTQQDSGDDDETRETCVSPASPSSSSPSSPKKPGWKGRGGKEGKGGASENGAMTPEVQAALDYCCRNEKLPLQELKERSLASDFWVENSCIKLHLKPEELPPLLDKFMVDSSARGKGEMRRIDDFQSHFIAWVKCCQNGAAGGRPTYYQRISSPVSLPGRLPGDSRAKLGEVRVIDLSDSVNANFFENGTY